MKKHETMSEAFKGVGDAALEAFLDVVRALQIHRLLDWLEARLR